MNRCKFSGALLTLELSMREQFQQNGFAWKMGIPDS